MPVSYDTFVAPALVLFTDRQLSKVQINHHFTVVWKSRRLDEKKVPWVRRITCGSSMRQCVCEDVKAVWEKRCFRFLGFFCCLWMMETITTGCHTMRCITSAFYRTLNYATMHSTHSRGSFTFGGVWRGGWNGGVSCYKAVNWIWKTKTDKKTLTQKTQSW